MLDILDNNGQSMSSSNSNLNYYCKWIAPDVLAITLTPESDVPSSVHIKSNLIRALFNDEKSKICKSKYFRFRKY